MNRSYGLEELSDIAKEVIKEASSKKLLFFGEMGSGKTTLIKEICKQLGTEDIISSPTFSLVNEYQTSNQEVIYHFDFYRIEDEEEAYDIGIEEYFYSESWCLVEWPDNIQNLLPLKSTEIHLTQLDDSRRNIQLKPSL